MPPQEISDPKKDDASVKPKSAEPHHDTPSPGHRRSDPVPGHVQGQGNDDHPRSVRTMGDVINSSLDAKFGGQGTGEQHDLSEKFFAPPDKGYQWSARQHAVQANLAEGRPCVTNMTYTVSDGDGGTRTISGATTYNNRGHQYLVDLDTKQKYRIDPPSEPGGQPTLTPFSRGERGEPLKVVEQKPIDGWSPRPKSDVPAMVPATPPVVADGQQPGQMQGGWRQKGDRDRGPNDATPPVAQPQQPQQVLAKVIESAMTPKAQAPMQPTDAPQVPAGPGGKFTPPGETQFRAQPPIPPQQMEAVRQQLQLQQNPQALADALTKMQQVQQIQQIQQGFGQQPGQIIQLQLQQLQQLQQMQQLQQLQQMQGAERGKPQQQFSPQDWQQLQLQQVAKLQQNQPGAVQPLDLAVRNVLSDKTNQPALQMLLAELRTGRLPSEQMLQTNKPLNDIIKAIGPEGLVDLRRVMMTNTVDQTTLNPRSREIFEIIAMQLRPIVQDKVEGKIDPKSEVKVDIKAEAKVEPKLDTSKLDPTKLDPKLEVKLDPKLEVKLDPKVETKVDAKLEPKLETKPETRTELKVEATKIDPRLETKIEVKPDGKPEGKIDIKAEVGKPETGKIESPVRSEIAVDPTLQNKEQQPKRDIARDEKDEKSDALLGQHKELKPTKKPDNDALPVDQAALTLALAEKKRKEQEAKDKDKDTTQEKDKKEPERRQKYIVRPGDTLESVATRMLRDKRLAGLIYEINKDTIPVVVIDRKNVPQLQERSIIWLPTPTEAKDYRGRMLAAGVETRSEYASAEDELEARFGKNWGSTGNATTGGAALEDLEDEAKVAYANRRKHIESLLGPLSSKGDSTQPKYVVRLGETLKSVAMKHPSLQDVTLWKLLAELNGLGTETDDKGNPLAKLNRGQSIILPSAAEIAAFRQRGASGGSKTKISGVLELPTRICPGCMRQTFAAASLCPGCGRKFEEPAAATKSGTETRTAPSITSPPSRSAAAPLPAATPAPAPMPAPMPAPTVRPPAPRTSTPTTQVAQTPAQADFTPKKQFSEAARLMTAGTPEDLANGYRLRLDVLVNNQWAPLVMYEIFSGSCLRHELTADGQSKTLRIDLPPQAAIELANNDIETNWNAYEARSRSTSQV